MNEPLPAKFPLLKLVPSSEVTVCANASELCHVTEAKTTYVNKVLNVFGIVKSVSVNQEHQQIILLKTSEPDASVNCTMEGNAVGIRVGDQVLLKGLCVGYSGGEADMGLPGDVFLVRCYRFT